MNTEPETKKDPAETSEDLPIGHKDDDYNGKLMFMLLVVVILAVLIYVI